MDADKNPAVKTLFFTTCALLAIAGNSVLCRLALGNETIDAASFTIIRLVSGVITLLLILKFNSTFGNNQPASKKSWKADWRNDLGWIC